MSGYSLINPIFAAQTAENYCQLSTCHWHYLLSQTSYYLEYLYTSFLTEEQSKWLDTKKEWTEELKPHAFKF